jgi:hypothetical protein
MHGEPTILRPDYGAEQPAQQRYGHAKAVTLATTAINAAAPNFNLKRAVIISENEHDGGYTADENDVVFVLPNKERVADLTTSATLLNTAKLQWPALTDLETPRH